MHLKGLRISVEGHEERHRPEIVRLVVLLRSLARDHLPYCAHQVVVGATQLLTEAAQDDTHTERGPVLLRGSGAQGTASHELSIGRCGNGREDTTRFYYYKIKCKVGYLQNVTSSPQPKVLISSTSYTLFINM